MTPQDADILSHALTRIAHLKECITTLQQQLELTNVPYFRHKIRQMIVAREQRIKFYEKKVQMLTIND